jgi:hypothetical protein
LYPKDEVKIRRHDFRDRDEIDASLCREPRCSGVRQRAVMLVV